jgi:hypothetical protein
MAGLCSRFYRSGRSPLNKKGSHLDPSTSLNQYADYQLIHLSINIVEDFLLLSKVGIMLGAADINDFDLGTYNYAS